MAKGKRHTATAFVTGGSGGVGKSFTARALAQALGSHGYVTLLVDGNPGQQSQRAFLGVDWSRGIEDAGISGAMASVLRPREVKAAFGFLPGPMAPQDPDLLDRYGDALVRLEGSCDFIIVDSDRLDGTQWDDPDTFAGGLIRPLVEKADARLVFRVGQSGSQLDDGMAALSAVGMPERTIVAAQCAGGRKPRPDRQWRDMLDGLAAYAGTDVWTGESARIVDTGLRGFEPGSEPDWLVRTAVWLGADKSRFHKERKGGLWGTPDPLTGHEARLAADRRRAAMLLRLRRRSETDGRECLPMLIDACCKDPAMLSLHVWAVDQAIFGTGRIRAGRHIETAAAWCGHRIGSPWTVDMGWLLDGRTGGSRLAAWTYAIALDNGFRPSGPDPYHS